MNGHSVVAVLSRTRMDQMRTGAAGIEYGSAGEVRSPCGGGILRSRGTSASTTTHHTASIVRRSVSRVARARGDNCNRVAAFISVELSAMDGPGRIAHESRSFAWQWSKTCTKKRHMCMTMAHLLRRGRTSSPARQDRLPVEDRDAQERQQHPDADEPE